MKYEIVAFYKQEIEEIRECAENIGRLYGWRYRCEKIPGSGKLLSACMGEDSVLCLLKRKSYSFYRLMKYVYALNKPVLVLQDHFSADTFQQLKIPVGYLKENKEKGIWANFLQRHHPGCRIEIIVPREKDEHIAAMVRNNLAFMERILKHSEARYQVVNEEKSFEKSLIKVLQDLSPGITLMMRPFRLFSFYYPYTVRLYRKHARSEVLIIPRDDSLYIPCH